MIGAYSPTLQVGMAMQDKFNNRVFTVLKEIAFFKKPASGRLNGSLILPKGLFAPNYYTFVFAIWAKDGTISDSIEGVCPINIHDNGTELAQYEGVDYGNIIIRPEWISN